MGLLPALTRDQVSSDLHALWDDCERTLPAFRNLWASMANSPIVFRHVWGQLLELKRRSPVAARYYEIAIVVVSNLNRCAYCVSHHTPLAEAAGLRPSSSMRSRTSPWAPCPRTTTFPRGRTSRARRASSSTSRTSSSGAACMPTWHQSIRG